MAVIIVPDFTFSGFYYPEVLKALQEYRRVNAPELTSESPYESHIQLERAFALVCHLNNTRLDIIANENLLDSLTLRESMRRLFKLIGRQLASATPSTVEQVIRLSSVSTVNQIAYVPAYSQFATESETGDEITFEATEDHPMDRTNLVSHVYGSRGIQFENDGVVDSAFPTRFTSALATFTVADVGRFLSISSSTNGNAGGYTITNLIDANTIEIATANFISETGLGWSVVEFGSDYADDANNDLTTFNPFLTTMFGAVLMTAHNHIQFNQIDFELDTPGVDMWGIWEYYDPTYSNTNPAEVTDEGGYIRANLLPLGPGFSNNLLSRMLNTFVRITYNPTGRIYEGLAQWDGGLNLLYIDTVGILGQTSVDTDILNYTIHAPWTPLLNQVDGTDDGSGYSFLQDGAVTFDWPMSVSRRWMKAVQEGAFESAYYIRFRLVNASSAIAPIFERIKISEGTQYFPFQITQGVTILDEIIGSSNGEPNQVFVSLEAPVFDDSQILSVSETVGAWQTWAPITSFLNSGSTDRHYRPESDDDGVQYYEFGNGTYGRKPPLGVNNIRLDSYRIGGDLDGNVGADQIVSNVSGINYVSAMGNPMAAIGWRIKEAGDAEDLERMKDDGPANIRNFEKAVSPPDIPRVAIEHYRTDEGSALVERGFAIEEAYGPKTIQLVTVGPGGAFLTAEQLTDVAEFFNGNRYSIPPVDGVLLLNSELGIVNYDPRPVDVTVTVYGQGLVATEIRNALIAYLSPLAEADDGTYRHNFGGLLAHVLLDCIVSDVSANIKNIVQTVPAADITLGPTQLPTAGNIVVNIVAT